jgi:UDP-glucose 4-epimerase
MKILVTGASGFICGYLVDELLQAGYEVVGLDDFSKYGRVEHPYDHHPRYTFVEGDAKDLSLLKDLLDGCDHFVATAAMIGGISYFHQFAYDLLAENERLTATAFDAAIDAHRRGRLKKISLISSSMVYECATEFPTPEGAERRSSPPRSTYGFQKLATEYFAQGAWEQYRLPFTIVRPFNAVGIGERPTINRPGTAAGDPKPAMSHVVPDLVHKILQGQDPLHILGSGDQIRHYTYAGDLARGIRLCLESPEAVNQDFNLASSEGTAVLDLAKMAWQKIHGEGRPFRYVSDPPYEYDVPERSPDTDKAARLLGFKAATTLSEMLDEVIPWIAEQIALGKI